MFKRKQLEVLQPNISEEFLSQCEKRFKSNPVNIIGRNAVNAVGSMFCTVNSNRVNEISHIFLNSVKKRNLRATNQGASGRCWMFAALNTFRHILIHALGLENFEFSEVYLFFWDKLERSNSYLKWFIDHPDQHPGDRAHEYMLMDYMCDGGWWNTFANLVDKYGVVPAGAMKETYQSDDSDAMNKIIKERLDSAVNHIRLNRHKIDVEKFRQETVQDIYDILVKFLGEPPKNFDWSFCREEDDESNGTGIVTKLTPQKFLSMVAPNINMNKDFVVLTHLPTKGLKYNTKYRIRNTNNVIEGENCTVFNLPIEDLAKYAMKSIGKGFAVWFVGDVHQCFNWFHSCLDDKLDDHKTIFGETKNFNKGDRILLRNVQGNHAMALTGFNLDEKGRPTNWQVENSWGYYDNETPGLDGFLNMSHSWFEKYVIQIVIHKDFLSRSLKKKINIEPIDLNPWDCLAPALRVGVNNPPANYAQILSGSVKFFPKRK
jgi:bleomycin hydrolase